MTKWFEYSLSREMIRVYNSKAPLSLYNRLDGHAFSTNRPTIKKFYSANRTKLGFQMFENKSSVVSGKLKFDWHYTNHSSDSIRNELKQCLFRFPSSALSFSVPECVKIERRLRQQIGTAKARRRAKDDRKMPDPSEKQNSRKWVKKSLRCH